MQIYKFGALAGAILTMARLGLADTLTFLPQPGVGGIDYSWVTSGNWFSTDAGGNLIPAGRLPLSTDTAIITVMVDAGMNGLRVQTLIATNNAIITNGTFAIENLVMLSGSSFNNSTVNVLVTLTVGGTNCALNAATMSIFGTASGIFQPIAPALAATLNLAQGAVFQDGALLTLTGGSQINSAGPPQSQLIIGASGALVSTNLTFLLGSATNHLIVDNSGLIRVDGGTLRCDGGIDWRSSGGGGEFRGANSNAFLLFATPFNTDAGVTNTFSGTGTNRWVTGATVAGAAQVSGNLELLDTVTGTGGIEVLGTSTPGGVVTWSNGSLALSTVTVDSGGTLLWSGNAGSSRQLSSCTINNSGLCAVRTGGLAMNQGAVIFNLAGGTFNLQADGTFSGAPLPIGGAFNNAGRLLKTSSGVTQFGTATPAQGPDFNNTGLVDVQAGQLNLVGGNSSGEFRTEPGADLWFWGGTHTLSAGADFTGAGSVHLREGISPAIWQVTGGIMVSNLELGAEGTIDAGRNTSTNPVTFGALLADANGSVENGNFVAQTFQMQDQAVLTNATLTGLNALTITGTNCALIGSTLIVPPTVTAVLAPLSPATQCTLNLNQGSMVQDAGILSLSGDVIVSGGNALPQSQLVISPGALLISSNLAQIQGVPTNHLVIDNSGTIRADGGQLHFGTGLDWKSSAGMGEFKANAPGTQISFDGPFHIDSGAKAIFSGAGTNIWSSGGTLAGEAQIAGYLLVLGDVSGTGTLHVLGNSLLGGMLNWANGALSLASVEVDVHSTFELNAAPGSACRLSGCSINNSGTFSWFGSALVLGGEGASINNLPGGALDLESDVALGSNALPQLVINNGGSLVKFGGTGLSPLAADFNNDGVVRINTGTMVFQGAWTQTLGSTTVDAGATLGGTTLQVQGGSLEGLGTIAANVVNSGIVNPGNSLGTLALAAGMNYQQTAAGTLALELGGATPGTQYDQLIVGATASLAGRLQLNLTNGFTPKPGDRFQVLICASESGSFSSVDPSPVSGTVWVPQYNGTNVTVTLAATVTLTLTTVVKGVLTVPFNTTSGLQYVVQSTDTLFPTQWQTLTTLTGNGSVMSATDSVNGTQRFYRVLVQ